MKTTRANGTATKEHKELKYPKVKVFLCVLLWRSSRLLRLPMLLTVSTCLTGCFGFLKPVESTTRHLS